MRIRKSRGQSEQPSLEPSCPALLQLAETCLELEGEVDMGDAELLIDGSHAASDQDDAQRNSTALLTKSEELPEMETGKEVAVRSVNPSLQIQDGEERVTPTANSLKGEGDVGMEKQIEEVRMILGRLREIIGIEKSKMKVILDRLHEILGIEEPEGASNLHPLLIEESESDSELPTWISPSKAPEGSLLHALYLQLLGAGSDGIPMRELFKCLKEPAEVLSFGSDWKVQVRRLLKTNPYFCEAKGYHYLVCNDQLDVQQPKSSPANISSTLLCNGASSSKTDLSSQHSTPATVQTGLSVDTHEGVVRTRRQAFQKAIAALSEQATEVEEMHQSMGDMQMNSSVADPTDSQLVSHGRPSTSSRKRKSPSSHDEKLTHHGHPIPGGLQATEAETFAKLDVQTGQRCIIEKDDTGNWRCHMMAMAGHTVCDYHRSLQSLQEDGKTSLSPNPGSPKYLTASKPRIAQDSGVQSRVQCGHRLKYRDGTWSSQCSRIAMKDHWLCEHHKQLREERKAREHADAQKGEQRATSIQHNLDSSIMDLPESHTDLDRSWLSLHPKLATNSPRISREDTPSHTEAAKNVDKPATEVSNHVDDTNGERLELQMPKNVPKRHHIAARKTAANVGPLKSQGLIRTPTTPPLPPPYGIRRKTPVKNREPTEEATLHS